MHYARLRFITKVYYLSLLPQVLSNTPPVLWMVVLLSAPVIVTVLEGRLPIYYQFYIHTILFKTIKICKGA